MGRNSSKPWFAPRRYGYGSGLPIAWQGWVVLVAYVLVCSLAPVVLLAFLHNPAVLLPAITGVVLAATAVLIIVCANKTRGGWRWRWGGKP